MTCLRNLFALIALILCVGLNTASAAVSGTKTALIMLVSFNDTPIDCTIAEVRGMVFTNTPLNVDSFYDHATWGNVRWAGDVINVSINYNMVGCNTDTWANAADNAARLQGYEPNNYTTRVYTFPSSGGGCGYAWASGNRVVNFHGTDLFAYGHEMGHSIGLHHAVTDRDNDGVFEDAYGGMDDCMGGESYTFNAPHKIWGGWLPQKAGNGGWRQITNDGVYQISPLEINPDSNPPYSQALKIVPPTGNPYFLSFRQPLDFNQGWTAAQVGKDGRTGTSIDPVPPISAYPYTRGVSIHRHSGGTGVETYEIAVLGNNQQFTIPGTAITIRQTAYDTTKVTLSITGFGGDTPVTNGVTFFQERNYGGAQSQVFGPGNYPLSQLQLKGVMNDWASSCKVPPGWTVTLYQHDNYGGTAWVLNGNVTNFTTLSPGGADNGMSSCRITAGPGAPPTEPTFLSAISGNRQVTLSWSPSPGATGYVVSRSAVNGGPYSTIATSALSTFVNSDLINGTAYYYVVTATNTFGASANSTQVSAVPTSDLVARWKFDEGSGTTAFDSSGNNNNGSLINSPLWVAGKYGPSALQFAAGNRCYVAVPNSSSLNSPTKAITLSAWIYAFDWSGNRRILQKGNADNQFRLLAENGELKFHLSGVDSLTAPLPALNTWIHLAATWDGSTMTIYTNGVEQISQSAAGTLATTGDPLAIARKHNSNVTGDYFNGRLDDVRIYNRALSPGEVLASMTNSAPVFVSDPITKPEVTAGEPYSGSIAGDASDGDGDAVTFTKLSGPAWLTVAANGTLSGTPLSANVGLNAFSVRVSDSLLSNTADLQINVNPAPAIETVIALDGANLLLNWTGGIAPYQVQTTTNLIDGPWEDMEDAIIGNTLSITPSNSALFYRVIGK